MATRTISTKLAISGESEYKAALSRVNSEIKTLQSELKLVESKYQNNANSMEALNAKGEALAKMFDAQKAKVLECKNALENARQAEATYAQQKAELNAKIDQNKAKLEALKNTTGDTAKEEKALTEENKALSAQLEDCDAKLVAAEKGVNNWQQQLNNAQIKLNDLDAEIQLNDEYMEEAKNSADGCATSIDRFGKQVKDSSEATDRQNAALEALSTQLAASGIKEGIEKIADALKACVTASADFEYAMSAVGAIANASTAEMDLLTAKAKEIGASTVFTAGEAAEALQYMALAGWSSAEMLQGVDGVISLAAASGENLGTVSDIVTDALTAFGLSAQDSGHFVDVLAQAAANSNTTVTMLGEAFKYAAPVAGALGYSVEDVAVAMGLMANNGIKGSMSGTALRNMFSALTGTIGLNAAAFGEVELTAQNTDGTMMGLSDTIAMLKTYFDQMTEAEKVNNAQQLVGQRAYAGLLAILNTTEEDYNSLTEAIQDCTGAAKTMADTKMDNLTGQVTLMKSAFDALKIAVGDDLNPALRELAKTGTDVLTWATEFVEAHKNLVPVIAAVVAGASTFLGIVTGVAAAVKIVIPLFTVFNQVLAANPIGIVAVAAATLAAGIATLVATVDTGVPSIKDLTEAARDMNRALEDSGEKLTDSLSATEATVSLADRYITKLEELEAAGLKSNEQQKEYHDTLVLLCDLVPELSRYIDLETDTIDGGTEALRKNTEEWKKNAEVQAYQERLTELYEKRITLLIDQEQTSLDTKVAEEELTAAMEKRSEAIERQNELLVEAQEKADRWNEQWEDNATALDFVSEEYKELDGVIAELDRQITDNRANVGNHNVALKEDAEAVAAVDAEIARMEESVEKLTKAQEENTGANEAHANAARDNAAAVELIKEDLDALAQAYRDAYDAAYASIDGQMGLFGEFSATISEDVNTVEGMMQRWAEQTAALSEYTENLKKAGDYGISDGLVQALSDGSAESAAYLQQIISEFEAAGATVGEDMPEGAAKFRDEFNAAFEGTQAAKDSFANTVASIQTDFEKTIDALEQEAAAVNFDGFITAFDTAFGNVGLDAEKIGNDVGLGLARGVEGTQAKAKSAFQKMAEEGIDASKMTLQTHSPSRVFEEIGRYVGEGMVQGIERSSPSVVSSIQRVATDVTNNMRDGARSAVDSFGSEFGRIVYQTDQQIASLRYTIENGVSGIPWYMYDIGAQIVYGMADGIYSASGTLYYAISSVVNNAIAEARAAAAVASPSKKTKEIFEYVGEGMIVGIENRRKAIEDEMQSIVDSALDVDVRNDLLNEKISAIGDRERMEEYINTPSTAGASGQTSITRGDTIINVYGAEGQSERELARIVADLINDDVRQEEAAWE